MVCAADLAAVNGLPNETASTSIVFKQKLNAFLARQATAKQSNPLEVLVCSRDYSSVSSFFFFFFSSFRFNAV